MKTDKITVSLPADTIALAEAMENVRRNVMIFYYQLGHIRSGQKRVGEYLSAVKAEMKQYHGLVDQIRGKSKERKTLLAEKEGIPFWNIPKHREVAARIAELTELLEELRSEKAVVLQNLQCAEDRKMQQIKREHQRKMHQERQPKKKS